ncbi:hypothetical protein GQ53DRAFT_752934 [Thozetella sp. PMI_491]|nr:hypothetical protein GQ53DRAFT_752934 [Thozetella sp. PMI_491]
MPFVPETVSDQATYSWYALKIQSTFVYVAPGSETSSTPRFCLGSHLQKFLDI